MSFHNFLLETRKQNRKYTIHILFFTEIIMQYEGIVKVICPKEVIGNDLEKQTLVLEENTDREFKGSLAVDFFRDKIALLEGVKVGDVVTVQLNSRCNESKTQAGRYFNSITCWKLTAGQGAPASAAPKADDDLPF